MRLSIRWEVDREGKKVMNFDVYIEDQDDADKALKALTIARDILPPKKSDQQK